MRVRCMHGILKQVYVMIQCIQTFTGFLQKKVRFPFHNGLFFQGVGGGPGCIALGPGGGLGSAGGRVRMRTDLRPSSNLGKNFGIFFAGEALHILHIFPGNNNPETMAKTSYVKPAPKSPAWTPPQPQVKEPVSSDPRNANPRDGVDWRTSGVIRCSKLRPRPRFLPLDAVARLYLWAYIARTAQPGAAFNNKHVSCPRQALNTRSKKTARWLAYGHKIGAVEKQAPD